MTHFLQRRFSLEVDYEDNPVLVAKWKRVFDLFFDIDGSQAIEWRDFELFLEKVRKDYGENSVAYNVARVYLPKTWHSLTAFDADGDHTISLEEFCRMMAHNVKRGTLETLDPYKKFLYALMVEAEGATGEQPSVGLKGYLAMMKFFGIKEKDATAAFTMFGKSPLTLEKFDQLWREYFTSVEMCAKGNYLFGLP